VVTGVTATAPLASSGGTIPDITIPQSNTSTDGYLSAVDWNTFNTTTTNVNNIGSDTQDPTGFVDPDNIVVAYDPATQKITLTHASGTIYYQFKGVRKSLTSPWVSSAHTNATGSRYFLYSTDGTNFTWSTTIWNYYNIQVAFVSYGATDKVGFREIHGVMPWQVHREAHDLLGTYRVSGGAPTAGTYIENTATDAATTPGFDVAVIKDEDLQTTIMAWTQGTYTTMRIGAASTVVFDTAASFPFRASGSYILVNNPTTGAETAATTGQFVNVYQLLMPVTSSTGSQLYRMVMLQPQAVYSSLAAAQAEDSRGLSLGLFGSITLEFVFYTRITYSLLAAHGNTGKCVIATGGISFITGSRQGQVTNGGFVPGPSASAKYLVQTADTTVPNAQVMAALDTGIVKNATVTGVQSIAVAGTDYLIHTATSTTAGTTGAGGALPCTPLGFITLSISGTNYKIPYYALT
jgi:hypothetical protein